MFLWGGRETMLRRGVLLGGLGLAGAGLIGSARSQDRLFTAPQTEGPYYPYDAPKCTDNDLVRLNAGDASALGQVTHLFGRATEVDGTPIANMLVEIWQCDANGRYHHPDDPAPRPLDVRFQGYGKTVTDEAGDFRFRTIKPIAYEIGGGRYRTPHVHLAASTRGVRRLTTQLYVEGDPLNDKDVVLAQTPAILRPGLIRPYVDGSSIEAGALQVRYDLVFA